ncbi:hypothetical protein L211DRAFT_788672 [Terfezia boudieri ATCC MYA-4762]|uniref:BTB domain-containing protein n=1 Tax=Terfezia boudieri ATCC MYA-4762 TaxID=1051890 RepID=A0A3N4LI50_9PEZI|nr:hypothetical protein L211DRAFT_788672 [Terfezia boudieri ATCC MYA-4762]
MQTSGSQRAIHAPSAHTSANFSSLVSTVVRTTGVEAPPLVGSSTTIVDDTLYVFGGQRLTRARPGLSNDVYALCLITREWSLLETRGEIPSPRYFHSVCSLGDTKLVCFGGMSPANGGDGANSSPQRNTTAQHSSQQLQREVVVMSDIHIFDIPSRTWSYIPTTDAPEGRYAHCATILPSSAIYSNSSAPIQALTNGVIDGTGGAEMVVVGGQNSANQYMDEISVFNLRSMKWTSTRSLERYCGAYRSVVSPLPRGMTASMIGSGNGGIAQGEDLNPNSSAQGSTAPSVEGHGMLIYSNYNFLEVRLELQVRLPDGSLVEKPLAGPYSPPGLRFPNGGVIDSHFVLSGTYLTSSKQEYALWVLDLRTLAWSKIDVGNVFSQGSWNRGILWNKRNTFLILGKKDRSLVEDYNQRRVNFNHICMVTLEAFGLYDNPRMHSHPALQRSFNKGAQEIGRLVLGMRDLADMEFLAVGGERVPVNSRIIARRWGSYFLELLNAANPPSTSPTSASLAPSARLMSTSLSIHGSHLSNSTITPQNVFTTHSTAMPVLSNTNPPTPLQLSPLTRPRTLYLPHTHQTLLTLVHYLYTSTLPPPTHPQSSPQILCSLLQLARPYRVDGLLEAVVERLHQVLDGKNAAAVFNAAAMAAGGGASTTPSGEMENDQGTSSGVSSVIGLQKRGLRGLMEGRRMRERGRSVGAGGVLNGTGT